MIVLFHEGTSHVHNGITCKVKIVDEFGFEPFLKQGWVLNPKDLYKEDAKKEAEKPATSKAISTGENPGKHLGTLKPRMKTMNSGSSVKK